MSAGRNTLLATCLLGTACLATGPTGETAPSDAAPTIPPLDAAAPAEFETATFALG